jgi:hypothetical protein
MPASSSQSASPPSATSASSSRSAADDRSEISAAIQHYFRAGDLGSSADLRAAFHPTAMMFWLAPSGKVASLDQRAWQQRLDANPAPVAAIERRIDWIRVSGDAAAAKLTSRFATFQFIDYVVLRKAGARWQIVGKVFHRREPADAPLNADRAAIEALVAPVTTHRIVDIDVGGTAAFVELAHDRDGTSVVGYALLLRTGDGWRILDPAYLEWP